MQGITTCPACDGDQVIPVPTATIDGKFACPACDGWSKLTEAIKEDGMLGEILVEIIAFSRAGYIEFRRTHSGRYSIYWTDDTRYTGTGWQISHVEGDTPAAAIRAAWKLIEPEVQKRKESAHAVQGSPEMPGV